MRSPSSRGSCSRGGGRSEATRRLPRRQRTCMPRCRPSGRNAKTCRRSSMACSRGRSRKTPPTGTHLPPSSWPTCATRCTKRHRAPPCSARSRHGRGAAPLPIVVALVALVGAGLVVAALIASTGDGDRASAGESTTVVRTVTAQGTTQRVTVTAPAATPTTAATDRFGRSFRRAGARAPGSIDVGARQRRLGARTPARTAGAPRAAKSRPNVRGVRELQHRQVAGRARPLRRGAPVPRAPGAAARSASGRHGREAAVRRVTRR